VRSKVIYAGCFAALALAGPLKAQQTPTPAQTRHLQELLAPDGARWAITRRMTPMIGEAIVCKDFATVEMLIQTISQARADRMMSAMTSGKSELMRQAAPEPDPTAFGCATLAAGTRVQLESEGPPVISTAAVRGVTDPAMIEYEKTKR
jgi:hypothetical protein